MEFSKSKNITIRAFEPNDAAEFRVACLESIDTVGKWMPWCHASYEQEEALSWFAQCSKEIESGDSFDLGIFRNADSLLVGSIAINQLDKRNRIGNIGYWVRESLQRQGYALEAIELIKEFGFQEIDLVRLEIVVHAENSASRGVAERAGTCFECLAKNRLIHNGVPETAAVYSFTNDS